MLVGRLGVVEKTMQIITKKLQDGVCDDVMLGAWDVLWGLSDNTIDNCSRFLNDGGVFLFLKCKKRFPEKALLLSNMMGLLGNVVEFKELRPKLMTNEFLEEMDNLLDSGIKVSFLTAGILAHIMSDGPSAWKIIHHKRYQR